MSVLNQMRFLYPPKTGAFWNLLYFKWLGMENRNRKSVYEH